MPTYEYKCTKCDEVFDIYQSFTDDALTDCPSGHKGKLKKILSAPGIAFKGSGFYKNDSRGGKKSATTASKLPDSKSDGSSTTSDTKGSESKTTDTKKSDSKKTDSSTSAA